MIASSIGKTFLNAYNRKYGKAYNAKEFFEKEFFPLFYDHPKYLQWVTNSPFVQGIRKGKYPTKAERIEKLKTLQNKIKGQTPDASIAIGFPSLDIVATTSGQITDLNLDIVEEDVYASWIGGGFGIGIQGGLVIYFDFEQLLLKIYEGWKLYRNYLEEIPLLRPNQIDTWNGQWLSHAYDPKKYLEQSPVANYDPFSKRKDGVIEVLTQHWVKVLFGISQNFPNRQITGYVFNLGQTNTTIGFIQFNLTQIKKPIHFYRILFGENDYLNNAKTIEELLGTEFSFRMSCSKGQIGVHALQPKGLMPFIRIRDGDLNLPNFKKPQVQIRKGEDGITFKKRKTELEDKFNLQYVTYKTYESWIMATLNDSSLYEKAQKYAQCFIAYQAGAGKGKKDRINHVKQALTAKNRQAFINGLITIVENEKLEPIKELVEEIVKMPADNFHYFLTLIRFRYAYLNQ